MSSEMNRRSFLKKSSIAAISVTSISALLGGSALPVFAQNNKVQAATGKKAAEVLPVKEAIIRAIHESREFKEFRKKADELQPFLSDSNQSYLKVDDLQIEYLDKVLDALDDINSMHLYNRARLCPTFEGRRVRMNECIRRFPNTMGAEWARRFIDNADK